MDIFTEEDMTRFEKIAKEMSFSKDDLSRFFLSLKITQMLQKNNPNLVLYGGTATQLFLDKSRQRLSVDADIITNLGVDEIKKIVNNLREKGITIFDSKRVSKFPSSIIFHVPLGKAFKGTGRLEIAYNKKIKLESEELESTNIFGIDIGKISVIRKTCLMPLKILTFNLGYCGKRSDKLDAIPKHIYDVYNFSRTFSLKELEESFKNFELACQTQKYLEECKESLKNCTDNIIKILDGISKMDYKGTNQNWQTNFGKINTILTKPNRKTRSQWIEAAKEIELLIRFLKYYIENDDKKAPREFMKVRNECENNTKNSGYIRQSLNILKEKYKYPRTINSRLPLTIVYMRYIAENFT